MTSYCIDRNDLITQSKLRIGTSPIADANGELNVYAIEDFKKNFLQNIEDDSSIDPVQSQVNQYGNVFYQSVTTANAFLGSEQLRDYPELLDRWEKGAITPLEYALFEKDYHYTPPSLINACNNGDLTCLKNLNAFYRDSNGSILGGFCSMLPSVFGAIGGFFTIIGAIGSLINNALSFLDKLKNLEDPIKAIIEKITVTSLINAIKEKIGKIIEETWDKVVAVVNNFNVEEIIGNVKTFIEENVIATGAAIKDKIASILTDDLKQNLIDKVKSLFDYGVSLFSNPNLQKIQFLISRFCGMLGQVEALIQDVKTPMDNYAFKYQRVVDRLERISGLATASAVSDGATRYSDDARRAVINSMHKQWMPPLSQQQSALNEIRRSSLEGLPTSVTNSTLTFDQVLDNVEQILNDPESSRKDHIPDRWTQKGQSANLVRPKSRPGTQYHTPTGEQPANDIDLDASSYGLVPSWSEIQMGDHPRFAYQSRMGERGWTNASPRAKAKLAELQKKIGTKFVILSAYRDEQFQAQLRRESAARGDSKGRLVNGQWNYGVAFSSYHLRGLAFDIAASSIPNRDVFRAEAAALNAVEILNYSWGMHVAWRGN